MRLIVPVLTLAIVAAVRSTPDADFGAGEADRPLPTRALGYYDATLRRVVIVGGPMQLRAGVRDGVWSWSGARWEPVTDSGPPSRGNAGVAYDARRRIAVFTGGAARAANDSSIDIVGESWETSPAGWRRIAGRDILPRDHPAMVYDEDRSNGLAVGGLGGELLAPWPSDPRRLR